MTLIHTKISQIRIWHLKINSSYFTANTDWAPCVVSNCHFNYYLFLHVFFFSSSFVSFISITICYQSIFKAINYYYHFQQFFSHSHKSRTSTARHFGPFEAIGLTCWYIFMFFVSIFLFVFRFYYKNCYEFVIYPIKFYFINIAMTHSPKSIQISPKTEKKKTKSQCVKWTEFIFRKLQFEKK